jgi:peroxiredoxin
VSGRTAKAQRRAAKDGEQRRQAEGARRSPWHGRRWLLFWPAIFILVGGLFAALQFTRSGSNAPPARNKAASGYPFAVGTPGTGSPAPAIRLPSTAGGTFHLAALKGKKPVLLYFQEGLTCQPCWDQIADIQRQRAKFRALGIDMIVSITTDPLNLIAQKARDEGLTIPILSDDGARVSDRYDARTYSMTWMKPARDGHTFILVGKDGRIRWRADYGGPPKYTMYLPSDALLKDLKSGLAQPRR